MRRRQRVLLAVSALCMMASVGLLIFYLAQGSRTRQMQQALREERAASADLLDANPSADGERPVANPPQEPSAAAMAEGDQATTGTASVQTAAMLPEFLPFFRKNSDMVGWLSYPAIAEIDFPIVQRDNNYYLDHDFLGRSSIAGTVFLDESNVLRPQDQNLILHGHNMKNGTMFGKLNRLLKESSLTDSSLFRFSTLYDDRFYIPYAISLVSINARDPRFVDLIVPRFNAEAPLRDYVDALKARSAYEIPVDVNESDHLLTLVTCYGDEDHERLVIGLRALRQGEEKISVYGKPAP